MEAEVLVLLDCIVGAQGQLLLLANVPVFLAVILSPKFPVRKSLTKYGDYVVRDVR